MTECIVKAGSDYGQKLDQISELLFEHLKANVVATNLVQKKTIKHLITQLTNTFGPLDIWIRRDHRISFGSHKGNIGYGLFTINYENESNPIKIYIAGKLEVKKKLWPENEIGRSYPLVDLNRDILSSGILEDYFDTVKEYGDLAKRLPSGLAIVTELRDVKISDQEYGSPDRHVLVKRRDAKSQQRFRKDLLDEYGSKCAVTGHNPKTTLEAAHIISHKDDNNGFSINNALLLRADIHLLIDRNELKINPKSLKIEFNNSNLLDYPQYQELSGRKLDLRKLSYNEKSQCLELIEKDEIDLSVIKKNIATAYKNY